MADEHRADAAGDALARRGAHLGRDLVEPAAARGAMFTAPQLMDDPDTVVVSTDHTADIKVDGYIDEPVWATLPVYDNMLVTDPDTMEKPRYITDTRWFYTARGLYIGVFMEQPKDTLLARLSSRDEFLNRDSWGITLDTSGHYQRPDIFKLKIRR